MARLSPKEFWALSKAKRKVLVAKDILKQIETKKYDLRNMGWLNLPDNITEEKAAEIDLYKNFSKVGTCTVCELGACILSIGHLGNNLNLLEATAIGGFDKPGTKAKKLIVKVFTPKEVWFLEACFEDGSSQVGKQVGYERTVKDIYIAEAFHDSFLNGKERAITIAKNIIRNKGKFIPSQDIKKA